MRTLIVLLFTLSSSLKIIGFTYQGRLYPVYQQPLNQISYIYNDAADITQMWTDQFDGQVLFAHRYFLAGEVFASLELYDTVKINYYSGEEIIYIVRGFDTVKIGDPIDTVKYYDDPNILVMQTCIDDEYALIVIAEVFDKRGYKPQKD